MTDNEIIQALHSHFIQDYLAYGGESDQYAVRLLNLLQETIALINRQKEEIDRLIGDVFTYKLRWAKATAKLDPANAEAIKKFAERLKGTSACNKITGYGEVVYVRDIDNLVKEMVGEDAVDEATAAKAWERANVGADNAE